MNNIINNLGLCRKAGKLAVGFDSVKQEIICQTACMVLTTQDLSEKTRKEINFLANKYLIEVTEIPLTMEKTQQLFHRKVGITAILDAGFAELIKKSIASCS